MREEGDSVTIRVTVYISHFETGNEGASGGYGTHVWSGAGENPRCCTKSLDGKGSDRPGNRCSTKRGEVMEQVKNLVGLVAAIVGGLVGFFAYGFGVFCGTVSNAFVAGYRKQP